MDTKVGEWTRIFGAFATQALAKVALRSCPAEAKRITGVARTLNKLVTQTLQNVKIFLQFHLNTHYRSSRHQSNEQNVTGKKNIFRSHW